METIVSPASVISLSIAFFIVSNVNLHSLASRKSLIMTANVRILKTLGLLMKSRYTFSSYLTGLGVGCIYVHFVISISEVAMDIFHNFDGAHSCQMP